MLKNTVTIIHCNQKYEHLESRLIDVVAHFDTFGDYIVEDSRNIIKRFKLGDEAINIKSFKRPNICNSIVYKYFRKSKAKRSFEYAEKLMSCNILTPFPIAYMESFSAFGLKRSYYISKHIDYDFDFRNLIHQPNFPDRVNILEQFTRFTFRLHENNIDFLDHSPGNTLIVKKENNQYDFYLIDLNRMRFKALDFNRRMHNFRRLWLSKSMIKIMSKTYSKLSHASYDETYTLMLKHSRDFQKKIDSKKLRKSGRKIKFGK